MNPTGDGEPFAFAEFQRKVYFAGNDGVNGYQLWKTDGTGPGTCG